MSKVRKTTIKKTFKTKQDVVDFFTVGKRYHVDYIRDDPFIFAGFENAYDHTEGDDTIIGFFIYDAKNAYKKDSTDDVLEPDCVLLNEELEITIFGKNEHENKEA